MRRNGEEWVSVVFRVKTPLVTQQITARLTVIFLYLNAEVRFVGGMFDLRGISPPLDE